MTVHMNERTIHVIHYLNHISMRFTNALKFQVMEGRINVNFTSLYLDICAAELVVRWVKSNEKKGSQGTSVKQEKNDNLII